MSCATNLQKVSKAGQLNGISGENNYVGNLAQPSAIHPQLKTKRMAVIAPDRPSGQAYHSVLMAHKLKADLRVVSIAPRVIGDKMNSNSAVEKDLALAIKKAHDEGYEDISIACNTLQLWKDRALGLTPCIAHKVQIVTTFEAMKKKFPELRTRPIWLGTTVTCRNIAPDDFQTLISCKLPHAQDLTQEIIWRTKAVTGANIATSGLNHIPDLDNPEILKQKVLQLARILKQNNITHIALGCTELPIAFGMVDHGLKTEDPAAAVAEAAKRQHFMHSYRRLGGPPA